MTASDTGKDRQQNSVIADKFSRAREYGELYDACTPVGHFFRSRLKRVFQLVGNHVGRRVLDVGCGPGMSFGDLVRRKFEVIGVDLSFNMIQECRRKFHDITTVSLAVGKIDALPFRDRFFDVALCMGVVEYVDSAISAFREVARVTKPGGVLVATMLNRVSPARIFESMYQKVALGIQGSRLRRQSGQALHLYSERDFKTMISLAGFQVENVIYYDLNPAPEVFKKRFPRKTVTLAEKLDPLLQSKLRFLGTGLIVKGTRR